MTKGKIILIVDDDVDILAQYKIILEKAGFIVKAAEGRQAAYEILTDTIPDCAVIDLMMEEKDSGFTLAYEIKNKIGDIPVIIVTSVTTETGMKFERLSEYEKEWIKADKILTKPIRPDQLIKEINQLIG